MEQKPFIRVDDARLIREPDQRRLLEEHLKTIGWSLRSTEDDDPYDPYKILDHRGEDTGWQYHEGSIELYKMGPGVRGPEVTVCFTLDECVFDLSYKGSVGIAVEERRLGKEEPIRGAFVIFRNTDMEETDGTEAGTD